MGIELSFLTQKGCRKHEMRGREDGEHVKFVMSIRVQLSSRQLDIRLNFTREVWTGNIRFKVISI